MKQDHADFDVLLERRGHGFTARVLHSPVGGTEPEDFDPPDVPHVTSLIHELTALRRVTPVAAEQPAVTNSTDAAKVFGARLFDALFVGQLRFALRSSQHVAATHHQGLRLRLRFSGAPELVSLPWELLYDAERRRFPCRLSDYPTVRVVDVPDPISPLLLTGPIRMLVVISSPRDLHPLDVDGEWERLEAAIAPLKRTGRLEDVRIERASLESLRLAVTAGEFHVFHFIGHGGVDVDSGEGLLAFTGPDGRAQLEPSSHLADLLLNSPIELAVLNSCEGGRVSAVDPYGSCALTLVEHGIPAVVAMQFEISDTAARAFSPTFYEQVVAGHSIDRAVTLGRQAILTTSPSEWSTPVLYLRPEGTRLFSFEDPTPALMSEGVPGPPRIIGAEVKGQTVRLTWHQHQPAGVTVTRWEVSRGGVPLAIVPHPEFADTVGSPGTYAYSVVALTEHQRSDSSPETAVRVRNRFHRWFFTERGRPRALVWLAAAYLAVVLVFTVVVAAIPVAAPTNVQISGTSPVSLFWDSPPIINSVEQWQVYRDGALLGVTKSPRWTDSERLSGTHRYTIRAVNSNSDRSASTSILVDTSAPAAP